ncbi:MAG: hypothetical protein BWY22_01447 [Bacteroidetes bacterium ADurb.Bin217]|nr:MAG: hypothetical protein BWY22_01447 [Bacteroidetes bacterium ADurb.Bin217]
MFQLIETIRIQNGNPVNLTQHQTRMDRSIFELFKTKNNIQLQNIIEVPNEAQQGIWKCRIIYNIEIHEISYTPYIYRNIKSLQIIEASNIEYPYKYSDRNEFETLLYKKQDADEILITKNGYITDTSYTNIIFFDGTQWVTPKTYLLPGTQRAFLLQNNKIQEKSIHKNDILKFKKARMINCFLDLEYGNDIAIDQIYS